MTLVVVGLLRLTLRKLSFLRDPQLNKYQNVLSTRIYICIAIFLVSYLVVYAIHLLYMGVIYTMTSNGRTEDQMNHTKAVFCVILAFTH